MLRRRWVVFATQAIAMAVAWILFLALVARHPWDGWFAAQVIVLALIVPSAYLWRTSQADKRQK